MFGLGVFSTSRFHTTQSNSVGLSSERTGRIIANTGRVLMIAAVAGLLAACGSTPKPTTTKNKFSPEKYGVKGSPKVVAEGQSVPKGGGRYMVGKKYKIAGKWYQPELNPNYKNVGLASWYGPTFHGRKTANGEVFDRNGLTAAHTTMPLPSYARVTNLNNGRSMIVRVNDRGPFHGTRIIDLSERVADKLGTKQDGVAKVKVEYVGKARMDGKDENYLMASYNGPDAVAPGGTFPGTQLAQADTGTQLAQVDSVPPQLIFGGAPAPAPRPYLTASASAARTFYPTASYQIAFDPAAAFELNSGTVKVASANTFTPDVPAVTPVGFTSEPLGQGQNSFEGIPAGDTPAAVSSYVADTRIDVAHGLFDFARSDSIPLIRLAGR